MNILTRYLVQEFFKLFIICQMVFIAIYLMIDFTSGIDDFIKAQAPRGVVVSYFLYKIPAITVQMLPVATLTTVIIAFSLMKRNNEITVLRACGTHVWKISQPVIVTAVFLSMAMFLLSETLVPYTSSHANRIWREEVKKEKTGQFHGQRHIWYKGDNGIYWMRQFDDQTRTMIDPAFYFFDDSFHLIRRIDARSGTWVDGVWQLREGIVQNREQDGSYDLSRFQRLELKIPEGPTDFVRKEIEPEEMGYNQLKRFAKRLRVEGYDASRYFVDLHIKIAFPFVVLIMALIGIPIALWKKEMGTPMAVSIGIALCFIYLLVLGLSRTLGFAGILPPILAAWLANSLFLFFGVYLMINVNR
ncbi:MAG: LPS export ABC transporter permease LptG [Deltaproteobacteria bacterium]|nr:LPS export ABC transporter permease LptG [Deltaproteobacteria bacterium]